MTRFLVCLLGVLLFAMPALATNEPHISIDSPTLFCGNGEVLLSGPVDATYSGTNEVNINFNVNGSSSYPLIYQKNFSSGVHQRWETTVNITQGTKYLIFARLFGPGAEYVQRVITFTVPACNANKLLDLQEFVTDRLRDAVN